MDHQRMLFAIIEQHIKAKPVEIYLEMMNLYNHEINHIHNKLYSMKQFDEFAADHYKPHSLIKHAYGVRHYDHFFTQMKSTKDLISYPDAESFPYFVPLSKIVNYIVSHEDPLGQNDIAEIFKSHRKHHIHDALYKVIKECISDLDLTRLFNHYCEWLEHPSRQIYFMSDIDTAMQQYGAGNVIDLVDDGDNFSLAHTYFIIREPESFSSDDPHTLITESELHGMVEMVLVTHKAYNVFEVKEFLQRLDNHHLGPHCPHMHNEDQS